MKYYFVDNKQTYKEKRRNHLQTIICRNIVPRISTHQIDIVLQRPSVCIPPNIRALATEKTEYYAVQGQDCVNEIGVSVGYICPRIHSSLGSKVKCESSEMIKWVR